MTSMLCTFSSIKTAFLPPHSKRQGVRCFAAAAATILPTLVLPVNTILSHRSSNSSFVSGTPPVTTLKHEGSRYEGRYLARREAHSGAASEGLSTAQHPAAIQPINCLRMRRKGKLKGPMMSTLPSGSFRVSPMPGARSPHMGRLSGSIHPLSLEKKVSSAIFSPEISPKSHSARGLARSFIIAAIISSCLSTTILFSPRSCASRHS
mmetsp:Transcript_25460/g.64227  ORF Transcript_25460/g.64227 Transcript_25460/m.64227 type:complete len:207 (-) Transcript_25460:113-733(-)